MTIAEARTHLANVKLLLVAADSRWTLGWRPISLDAVQGQRDRTQDAIAPFVTYQLSA